ncbi:LysR family transcriptional regulator [Azohydromonas caseinilytica]|uniref:LysR family transcriptional regulator n=1 Tax=Azohydromonas caseinilytica TaxID=2728836 RepID=A0A848FFI4_9BURK|nr:LysR family transcriptional regulator [Azohydromonas caseinilytica]NML16910.1 LysR family transcriptional regulator [Azohydromonas caseinilytica]
MSEADLSTRQLRAFVALAETRNFTRAAARLHLSQPAFSALIRALEEALGARLFDRSTRHVEPTVEGALFLESAQRLLRDLSLSVADLGEHVARRRGRVALAALPALAAGWLPPRLAAFRQRYPDIELDVADALSEDCVERVRAGRADFALAALRAGAPELLVEPFCSDAFHLVCPRSHPLAGRDGVALQHLAGEPFIHLARTSSVRQHIESALWPLALKGVMELEQLSTVAGMVRAGLGITVVPTLTLFHFEHPDLVTRPVRAPGLRREIFTIRRRDRSLSVAAQALFEALVAQRPAMEDAAADAAAP